MAGDPMPSITIVKKFTYRGDTNEEWQNEYHFDSDAPANDTRWKAFADAIILAEKAIVPASVKIVRAFGHEANNKVAVWSYDYENGTGAVSGTATVSNNPMPGDVAAWIRYSTTQRTSLGKPIFLRNYYHGVYDNGATLGGNSEQLLAGQKTAFQSYGNAWVSGFSDGTATHRRAGPRGAIAQSALAATYLTTRTLKKRGKRKPA